MQAADRIGADAPATAGWVPSRGGGEGPVHRQGGGDQGGEIDPIKGRLTDARLPDADVGEHVLATFDFAQNAAQNWAVSGKDDRRKILCASY